MDKLLDNYQEHEIHNTYDSMCSTCFAENLKMKPSCEVCDGKGYFLKTEWTGTDTSYEVEIKCHCKEE